LTTAAVPVTTEPPSESQRGIKNLLELSPLRRSMLLEERGQL
jgi:hypothetical protein